MEQSADLFYAASAVSTDTGAAGSRGVTGSPSSASDTCQSMSLVRHPTALASPQDSFHQVRWLRYNPDLRYPAARRLVVRIWMSSLPLLGFSGQILVLGARSMYGLQPSHPTGIESCRPRGRNDLRDSCRRGSARRRCSGHGGAAGFPSRPVVRAQFQPATWSCHIREPSYSSCPSEILVSFSRVATDSCFGPRGRGCLR